jgi:hypothetical protein
MFDITVGAGAVGAGAASRYLSGFDQMKRLLVAQAPAPQHCLQGFNPIVLVHYCLANAEKCVYLY